VLGGRDQNNRDPIKFADGSTLSNHEIYHFYVVDSSHARSGVETLYTNSIGSLFLYKTFKERPGGVQPGYVLCSLNSTVFLKALVAVDGPTKIKLTWITAKYSKIVGGVDSWHA